jgi:3-oxoacyl-[acyl-carrier protein] reductase
MPQHESTSTPGAPERVALVTGGSQGLGAAIGRRLARGGHSVVLVARGLAGAEAVAKSIREAGGTAMAIACDVRIRDEVERSVAAALEAFGRLDILVSNAGVTRDALIHTMTDDEWRTVIDTHLTGGFLSAQAAQRPMVLQRYGRIVFIGSTAAVGNRGQVNYSAAKAGLQGMTRTLALELGPFGITVNLVSPGHIDSELTRASAERLNVPYEEVAANRISLNSIKRVGVPDDIASAVAFLASEESGYITGQVLSVSGRPTIS